MKAIYQACVGERLREIAYLTVGDGIELLGKKVHVIADAHQPSNSRVDARIVGGKKARQRHHQQTGIKMFGSIKLHKRVKLGIETFRQSWHGEH